MTAVGWGLSESSERRRFETISLYFLMRGLSVLDRRLIELTILLDLACPKESIEQFTI